MRRTKKLKELLVFAKYEYGSKFRPCEELHDMTFDAETATQDVKKNKLKNKNLQN
jgi:hypothetical protein